MNLNSGRYSTLVQTIDGFRLTGVPLIGSTGTVLFPAGHTDDIGIYYFVPLVSRLLDVSLPSAINIVLGSFILLGLVIGIFGFFKLFKLPKIRLVSAVGLILLASTAFEISNVYVTYMFAVTTTAPLVLAFSRQKKNGFKSILPWMVFLGVVLGYCNFIRSHSGTGMMIFLALWMILDRKLEWKEKAILTTVFIAFFLVPKVHFNFLEKNRDNYLQKNLSNYRPYPDHHPLWHSVYIGLGYLPNSYGIQYNDSVAAQKVTSVDPKIVYCSSEYDEVLKQATLEIVRKDPFFILKTVVMKTLALLFYLVSFSNFGLLCFFYVRPSWRETLPMITAGCFYALPGILIMPFPAYVLGMISLAAIFGIFMIGLTLEKYTVDHKLKVFH